MTRSYATFSLPQAWQQMRYALEKRQTADKDFTDLHKILKIDEQRMAKCLGRDIRDLQILEVGPGQGLERAAYFGRHNTVEGLDLDVISRGMNPSDYWHMYKKNGLGRVAKTVGRKLILQPRQHRAWAHTLKADSLTFPAIIQGDICEAAPATEKYDLVMSWSVFEHLTYPRKALDNIIQSLKPGGIFYISLHLYTSNNGHHDIRAFTGNEDSLPLWAHLRASTRHQIVPSSWLNCWRLPHWQDLLSTVAPDHIEYLEKYEHPEKYGTHLKGDLAEELKLYTRDELLTVNIIYAWQKPK